MRLALTQLMQKFSLYQRTLFRRLLSPVIDKLLFATKADPASPSTNMPQYGGLVPAALIIQDARKNAAFEGISSMDCPGWRRYIGDHQRRD